MFARQYLSPQFLSLSAENHCISDAHTLLSSLYLAIPYVPEEGLPRRLYFSRTALPLFIVKIAGRVSV